MNYIGSPKSKARYYYQKNICISCIRELRNKYDDTSFYENEHKGFCECCETEQDKVLERF